MRGSSADCVQCRAHWQRASLPRLAWRCTALLPCTRALRGVLGRLQPASSAPAVGLTTLAVTAMTVSATPPAELGQRRQCRRLSHALRALTATPAAAARGVARQAVAPPIHEMSSRELQDAMTRGEITCALATAHFCARIEAFSAQGPRLNAVLEVNPDAALLAAASDRERAAGHVRGACARVCVYACVCVCHTPSHTKLMSPRGAQGPCTVSVC